ncbi:hypothetical protein [Flavobacterium sp.]|uniref:hypothetical protein n=1 Tax=Flavobacterium sp. TaxID=239 RepID=UPI0038FC2DE2
MKNNNIEFQIQLPSNIKFATENSTNERDILLEIFIANLIHNGSTFDELLEPTKKIKNIINREIMKTKITNTILDFVNLNPQYIYILKQGRNSELLNSLDIDFII